MFKTRGKVQQKSEYKNPVLPKRFFKKLHLKVKRMFSPVALILSQCDFFKIYI